MYPLYNSFTKVKKYETMSDKCFLYKFVRNFINQFLKVCETVKISYKSQNLAKKPMFLYQTFILYVLSRSSLRKINRQKIDIH